MGVQEIQEAKRNLRSQITTRLTSLAEETRREKSQLIFSHLMKCSWWRRCCLLFAYVPMELEIDLFPVIFQALREGKIVALPRISSRQMNFHILPPGTLRERLSNFLERHSYGFFQPKESLPVIRPSFHLSNLMLVPGLAFDREGNRLGRGKGYYDGYISGYESELKTLGVCFAEQIVDRVPNQRSDKKIQVIMSDSGIVYQKT